MPITKENLHDVIQYHRPDEETILKIAKIREATEALCNVILDTCPPSGDQQAALRKAREAMMTANACLVLGGIV